MSLRLLCKVLLQGYSRLTREKPMRIARSFLQLARLSRCAPHAGKMPEEEIGDDDARATACSRRIDSRRRQERGAKSRSGAEPETHQPPPPVRKRRMKRSCSERMWLDVCPSIESSDASLIKIDSGESYRSSPRDVNENRRPPARICWQPRAEAADSHCQGRFTLTDCQGNS